MPIDRQYFVEENYVLSTHIPPIPMDAHESALQEVAKHPDFRPSMHFVIDRRRLSLGDYAPYTLQQMQSQFGEHLQIAQGHKIRVAQVVTTDFDEHHYMVRLLQSVIDMLHGRIETAIFYDLESAVDWVKQADARQQSVADTATKTGQNSS